MAATSNPTEAIQGRPLLPCPRYVLDAMFEAKGGGVALNAKTLVRSVTEDFKAFKEIFGSQLPTGTMLGATTPNSLRG